MLFAELSESNQNDGYTKTQMNIADILNDPEKLMTLTDGQLKALIEPYISQARQPLLPPEKAKKEGVQVKVFKEMIDKNRAAIEQLKALRKGL